MLVSLLTLSLAAALGLAPDSEEQASWAKVLWGARTGPLPDAAFLPNPPQDSILMYRAVTPLLPDNHRCIRSWRLFTLSIRLPFMLFGLWLGGALWWVTRRLYNNSGGYIALALYCSSAVILQLSSRVNAEIIAAWGLFGIVYTAIGVAHTLYAPPKKWRPRIVLLGTAFGITAAAHLSTATVGVVLAAFFMLYLAPGRRLASIVILAEASIIAFLILWGCYGFSGSVFSADLAGAVRLSSPLHPAAQFLAPSFWPLLVVLAVSLLIFITWPRTRYFGNWAPLTVFTLLVVVRFQQGDSWFWALPFAFVFIGGIFADLLETRWRPAVMRFAVLAIATQETLTVFLLLQTLR